MRNLKSPSGAAFPYYYKNGELFGMHLESFGSNEYALVSIMQAEEEFFLKQSRRMAVWMNFYGTNLTTHTIGEFVSMVAHLRPWISKLGIVGCSWLIRWKIKRAMKKVDTLAGLPVRYGSDPEEIKTWLVSETQ